ncbi:MAG: DNA polymerase I, partial [Candidatus Cloacimonetes bacterium]|nr:DNA polymerase I [Candidatus Cloacimonadota bacterium]
MRKRLFLIDGTAILYRSHFAFIKNPLINSKGQTTSALYGVVSSFLNLINEHNPELVAVTFDRKEKTFRHQISASYKANRPPMPEALVDQLPAIHQFFTLIGMKEISVAGYEADDIIGSLAKKYESQYDIVIVSGDKDFSQLVSKNICLYDSKTNRFIHESEVLEKFSISPEQFIDYLALMGDTADNIPGAKGIGPKAAVRLLAEYDNIDILYSEIIKRPDTKEKEKLIASKDEVFLSRILATINSEVNLEFVNERDLIFDKMVLEKCIDFLESFELHNLVKIIKKKLSLPQISNANEVQPVVLGNKEVLNEVKQMNKRKQLTIFDFRDEEIEDSSKTNAKYTLIKNKEHLNEVLSRCSSEAIAIDTETTGIDFMKAELVGLSFCFSIEEAFYIPFTHTFAENLEIKQTLSILEKFCKGRIIVGHNLKYDVHILNRYDFRIEEITTYYIQVFDTMLAAYILDPGKNNYSLSECAKRELKIDMTPISELIGKRQKQINFTNVDTQKACQYSAEDAWTTYGLYKIYEERLKKERLDHLYYNIEIPLIFVLAYMEEQGVNINTVGLNDLSGKLSQKISDTQGKIYELCGEEINLNSPQQLSSILFDKLKIKPIKKIQTGYSTDNEVLEILSETYPIARLLIEFRHLTKMQNTYVNTLPKLINTATNRVHSSFNQTITSTGRLSSSNPNLQNIPIRSDLGVEIRKAFTTSDDKYIVSADYSQIELRLLAILSDDQTMINAFKNKADIHLNTAAKMFNKDINEIDKEERSKAKTINFGIIYGMGAKNLGKELGISTKEAADFITNYFEHFPTIRNYIDKQKFTAHQLGFVET